MATYNKLEWILMKLSIQKAIFGLLKRNKIS